MAAKSPVLVRAESSAPSVEFPTVSIILPVRNEEAQLDRCLRSVAEQTYSAVIEIVVADGGSTDKTRSVASAFDKVRVVDNPRRIRPAGLNAAIAAATGEIIVRVDARTALAPDYVERCVDALGRSGAAIVGGQMRYEAETPAQRGIVAAMTSRLGAGPAAFRREGGRPRYVDTVYLGAFRAETIRDVGGYDEWSGGNEDAELAWRAQRSGGVYLDPSIKSLYLGRDRLGPLARQFYRYGHNRARTIRKHPSSLSYRQLAVPALFLGLASPLRRQVLAAYAAIVLGRGAFELTARPGGGADAAGGLSVDAFRMGAGVPTGHRETGGNAGMSPGRRRTQRKICWQPRRTNSMHETATTALWREGSVTRVPMSF